MNEHTKAWVVAAIAIAMALLVAAFCWERDREREKKLENALAQAAKDMEATGRLERLQKDQAWQKVFESADALNDPGLKDEARAAAFSRFRGELMRLKSHYVYPQLGAGR
jgi:biopolymer transport protein ExbB/TolQ